MNGKLREWLPGALALVLGYLCTSCVSETNPGSGYAYGPIQHGSGSASPTGGYTYGPAVPAAGTSDFATGNAQADYDRALAAYNEALQEQNNAQTVSTINNMNWAAQQNAAPGVDKGMAFLGMLAGSSNKGDAAREVEVARQRLEAARQRLVTAGLQAPRAAMPGSVSVIAVPEDSEVFVDGVFVGNSPCTLKLPHGNHSIKVKAQGFDPFERDVGVLPQSEITIRATLNRSTK